MGKLKKKGESGEATAYISRTRAIRKMQLTLGDFRRLCILKGIYPREPKNKKKVGKGSNESKTYYFLKDIQFLAHEPLIKKFRDFKAFVRKMRRAHGRHEFSTASHLKELKPTMSFDHLVKERYPTFADAVRDLDDALSLMFLFAQLPNVQMKHPATLGRCRRLCNEFMHYVIESHSLRRVFLSIKGIYYQVEIMGQTLTWITPYQFCSNIPANVDFKVMESFLDFYVTLLKFVNFRLFQSLNITYPPKINGAKEEEGLELGSMVIERPDIVAAVEAAPADPAAATAAAPAAKGPSVSKKAIAAAVAAAKRTADDGADDADAESSAAAAAAAAEDDSVVLDSFPAPLGGADGDALADAAPQAEEHAMAGFKGLFKNCWFFLSREVPLLSLEFVIRSFGGNVSWAGEGADGTGAGAGPYPESDARVTHHIVDRPKVAKAQPGRKYIQPQWVFDCVNARKLIAVADYAPGQLLPPHLSPFAATGPGEYVPDEAKSMEEREVRAAAIASSQAGDRADVLSEDELYEKELLAETKGETLDDASARVKKSKNKNAPKEDSTKELAKIMMTKKNRRLYDRIEHSKGQKKKESDNLKRKKKAIADTTKRTKGN